MNKNYFFAIVFCGITVTLSAQSVGINSTGGTPNVSSILDMNTGNTFTGANGKGVIFPNVALTGNTDATTIGTGNVTGMMVYNTATVGAATSSTAVSPGYYYWNGAKWISLNGGNGGMDWSLLGNAGTSAASNFLGTTDANDLVFRTNNTAQARITTGGFVGVGTTTPRGFMHLDGAAAATAYRMTNTTTGNAAATDGFKIEMAAASSNIDINNQENASITLSTNATARTVLSGSGTIVHTSGTTGTDGIESVTSAGMLATVGAFWGLNGTPAANGTGYGAGNVNYSVIGMIGGTRQYSFGTIGQSIDVNRCGSVQGTVGNLSAWGCLGYRNSGGTSFSGYFTAATGAGAGFNSSNTASGLGIGCYSDFAGSIVKGEIIGQISMGELMASYNVGNEYTSGYKADIVKGETKRAVAFSNSSTELKIYSDGSANLNNGGVFVKFEEAFTNLYSKEKLPTITVSPMGQCNGLYIASVEKDGFWVKELNNGSSNVQFSWIAIGKRIDVVEVPNDILDENFDKNVKNVIANEDNKDVVGKPIWWDGGKIIFDREAPAPKTSNKPKVYNPNR